MSFDIYFGEEHLSVGKWGIRFKNNIYIYIYILQGPDLGGVFHCRCERTQTQQAQYNELGREAGLRTGPL